MKSEATACIESRTTTTTASTTSTTTSKHEHHQDSSIFVFFYLQEDIEYEQGQRRSLKLENETNVVLGNLNRQLSTVTEAIEGSPDERNDDNESENKVMDELKKKSRVIRNSQDLFVKQMKESLDDVVKAQEGLTKSLSEIGMV